MCKNGSEAKGTRPPSPIQMAYTFHTYAALVGTGDRLAATDWSNATAAQAVAATLRLDPSAVVLVATDHRRHVGLAPGGLACIRPIAEA